MTEDLGEVLEGDRLVNTPYEIRFMQDTENHVLCSKKLNADDLYNLREAIAEDYYFQVLSQGALPTSSAASGGVVSSYSLSLV